MLPPKAMAVLPARVRPAAVLLAAMALLASETAGCCCILPPGNGSGIGTQAPPAPRVPLPGAIERIVAIELELPDTKESGEPWDVGGGAPDPYVVIRQDGEIVATTERLQDTASASWRVRVMLAPDAPWSVDVLDRDAALDDPVTTIEMGVGTLEAEDSDWGGYYDVALEDP